MRTILTIAAFVLLLPCLSFSQHEMLVGGVGSAGFLNDVIAGDTTASGARNDSSRIYVLERDSVYLVNTKILNTGWTLRVRAAYGSGNPPVVYEYQNIGTGAYPATMFEAHGDLYLTGLAMVGYAQLIPNAPLSPAPTNIVLMNALNLHLGIDSCMLVAGKSATVQTSVALHTVKITNSLFAQSGNLWATNIGNGRPLDLRNVSVDSVTLQNCTFTDGTDRIVRHYASVGGIGYFMFDHNTVVNSMSMHGCLGLGILGKTVIITNNVFVDNFALGYDSTDAVREAEFGDPNERGPSGSFRMYFVGCVPPTNYPDSLGIPKTDAKWYVSGNFYSVTPALQAWYDTHAAAGLGNLLPLSYYINSQLGKDSTKAFTKETITFAHPTRNLVPFCTWYWLPAGANKQKVNTGFTTDIDFYRPGWTYYKDTLNLTYQTTAAAYTGASGGFPAGDLNWYPSAKAAWALTNVEPSGKQTIPTTFSLHQNYPNPFNPSTKISFDLPQSGNVSLKVFNILGQEVASLVDSKMAAGTHEVTFDASKLSSGVYIYRLSSGSTFASKKMMLLK
ncbi:MAG TPA: T9SS type A sorting domain-containing protein [Bacteroidota bacterium]|nr:T9SS type A sorting domain-containing protein [Bacteroidota bacterium]